MLCGEKDRFAIEFDIDLIVESPWVYGTFFFWAKGRRYGDPEDAVALNASSGMARHFLDDHFNYERQEWFEMPKEELFLLVQTQDNGAHHEYSQYIVDYVAMSSFDKDKDTFILVKSCDGTERMIWRSEKDNAVGEIFLKPGEFERILFDFIKAYEMEKERIERSMIEED